MAQVSMSSLASILRRQYRCRSNSLILGQPGIGKTWTILQWIKEMEAADPDWLTLIYDGGALAPTDTTLAMPAGDRIKRLVDEQLLLACEPGARGVIYVGELMMMSIEVARGWQRAINREYLAPGKRLSEDIVVVGDGQRTTDRSGAQAQGRAFASRLDPFEVSPDAAYNAAAIATFHPALASFLRRHPDMVDNYGQVFDPKREANDPIRVEGAQGVWCCLRKWAGVSRLLVDAADHEPVAIYEFAARVGEGPAQIFNRYSAMLDSLASYEQIITDPKHVKIPKNMDEQYALSTVAAYQVMPEHVDRVIEFISRLAPELQIAFFGALSERLDANPEKSGGIRLDPAYQKWAGSSHIVSHIQSALQ